MTETIEIEPLTIPTAPQEPEAPSVPEQDPKPLIDPFIKPKRLPAIEPAKD
jgi:hypothetical protein